MRRKKEFGPNPQPSADAGRLTPLAEHEISHTLALWALRHLQREQQQRVTNSKTTRRSPK
jgi:hypothetical protein